MNEKAERLIDLFSKLFEDRYDEEKSASVDTPLCSLSSNDLKVLCSLNGKDFPNIKEISDELSFPMSTLTGIFNKLVSKDLVSRDRCEFDRRVVRVNLTEKGYEAAKIKKANSQNFALSILSHLNESEQEQLLLLLEKIVSR
jgi:DNA-binding MarR family transcriptional regulator